MNVMDDELLSLVKSYTTRMSLVCIITALPAESRVFIDSLKLKPILDHGWRLYGNSGHLLLQTGLGKLKSAAATSAVLHLHDDIQAVINVGVAGGTDAIGTQLLAHCVVDQGSGFSTYPHLPPQRVVSSLPSTTIETLDKPSDDYRAGVSFDMEASGIFSAASPYLSSGSVQCVKVISDNPDAPLGEFKKDDVTALVSTTVPVVNSLLDWYAVSAKQSSIEKDVQHLANTLTSKTHHSVNDKLQLSRLLHQHHALSGELPELTALPETTSAASLRTQLNALINEHPLRYGDSS